MARTPTKLRLSVRERKKLEDVARSVKRAKEYRRARCLLLKAEGKGCRQISEELGISLRGAQRYVARYGKLGVGSVKDKPRSGRPPTVTKEVRLKLVKASLKDPRLFGFLKNNWSLEMLKLYLEKETGVRISNVHIMRLLKRHGIAYKRPKLVAKGSRNYYRKRRLENYRKAAPMLVKKNSGGFRG